MRLKQLSRLLQNQGLRVMSQGLLAIRPYSSRDMFPKTSQRGETRAVWMQGTMPRSHLVVSEPRPSYRDLGSGRFLPRLENMLKDGRAQLPRVGILDTSSEGTKSMAGAVGQVSLSMSFCSRTRFVPRMAIASLPPSSAHPIIFSVSLLVSQLGRCQRGNSARDSGMPSVFSAERTDVPSLLPPQLTLEMRAEREICKSTWA